ncbi:DUF1345 domain-containing protein [Frondihabitans peucedani]|uniref:DUF1345 domain-containing protein n=1 Tax=Frondihabitans peucedani TaxID=598626 RepID=A0ABP8DX18_9MICO
MQPLSVDATRGASTTRVVVMFAVGIVVGVAAALLGLAGSSLVIGWIAACLVYLIWVYAIVFRFDGEQARQHARAEDPDRSVSQILLVLACVGSLGIVGFTVIEAGHASGARADALAILAVVSVVLSWFLIHTLFMLRYAVQYYAGEEGGIDFNQPEPPDYRDFAYLAFDLGMTYQVSDTTISNRTIRHLVTRHCLLSYLFGTVILATLINLVAGLGS